ncbi:MAG: hypothetical protein ACTSYI_13435 [Promethearchaeota archaeon]
MTQNMEYPFLSYRLLPDGSIFQVDPGEISSYFININIVAIYFYAQKRLYIWIGERVSRELQNQIPHIERQILERNPNITILRHFTVEGVKYETEEFLRSLHIPLEEFKQGLIHWDNFQKSNLEQIKNLRIQIEELKISNEFGRIKEIANQIINLAEKISNDQIVQEHEALISSLIDQEEGEKEKQIQQSVEEYAQTFNSLHQNHEFQKAKDVLDKISKILEDSEDRGFVRKWKYFYIKLQQDEELYLATLKKKEQSDKEESQNALILELKEMIDAEWNDSQWKMGYDHTIQVIKLLKNMGKFEEIGKFNKLKFGFEEKIEASLEKEEIPTEEDAPIQEEAPVEEENSAEKKDPIKDVEQIQEDVRDNQINEYDNLFDDFAKQVEDLEEQKNYSAGVEICNKILEILHLTSHSSEIEVWESQKNEFFQKLEVMLNQKDKIEKIEKLEKSYNDLLIVLTSDEESASWNYGIGHCREIMVVLKKLDRELENRQWLHKQQYFEQKLKEQKTQHQAILDKYQELSNNIETKQKAEQWDSALKLIDEILLILSSLNLESERDDWESQKKSIMEKREILTQEVLEEIKEEEDQKEALQKELQEEKQEEPSLMQQDTQNPLYIEYSQLKDSIFEVQKNQYWSDGIKDCVRIVEILPEIDKKDEISHYQALKDEFEQELHEETTAQDYSYYEKVDVAQYSSEEVNLKKYPELLRQANTIESSQKKESKEILLQCLAIIKSDEEEFIENYPRRRMDRKTLEKRLAKIAKI